MSELENTFTNVEEILQEYADEFCDVLKSKLEQDGRKASGRLIRSIRGYIKATADEYRVMLHAEDYMKYVDEGRRAASKYPPRDAIAKWIRDKHIVPREINGKLPTEKQLTFLISRAIADNGTIKDLGYKGGHYIEETARELNIKYIAKLQVALEKDWEAMQIRIIDRINKMVVF